MKHTFIKYRLFTVGLAVGLVAGLTSPRVLAADKETRQMMADIRMLQEQTQQLQNLIGALSKSMSDALETSLKAVNTRIDAKLDEQAGNTRKGFADQKLSIDAITRDVGVLREKVDESNVRVGSLTQEVDALRKLVTQINASARPAYDPVLGPPDGAAPEQTAAPVTVGVSPKEAWAQAFSDFTGGNYGLAIQGFEAFIKTFPTNPQAAEAQLNVCSSYLNLNNNAQAIQTCDLVIRNYPTSNKVPGAYYRKGQALKNLKRTDEARNAFQLIVTTYPTSDEANLARTQLMSTEFAKKP
jgi:tol-pal system protein YbgF